MARDPYHVDVVVHPSGQDIVVFASRETWSALAVLLHVFDDSPDSRLSPMLVPLMRTLDRKLAKVPENTATRRDQT